MALKQFTLSDNSRSYNVSGSSAAFLLRLAGFAAALRPPDAQVCVRKGDSLWALHVAHLEVETSSSTTLCFNTELIYLSFIDYLLKKSQEEDWM